MLISSTEQKKEIEELRDQEILKQFELLMLIKFLNNIFPYTIILTDKYAINK